jgi:hypothetical protein
MPSNYDQIRADNIRGYGENTHHLEILSSLYSDRTHFIYELLQNAEDAEARKVEFTLRADRLEIRHNGRPFNGNDVRGICDFGKGTKTDDLTKIGKFGIGFKSVYAYTRSPEIHSVGGPNNREDFRIYHYVRPEAVAACEPGNGWTTLFILPFDRDDVSLQTANREIADRLRALSVRTLLFLRSIEEVEYQVAGATSGIYLRETKRQNLAREVTVIGQNSGSEELESWLVFDEAVGRENETKPIYIEVAFKLEEDEKSKQKSIVAIPHSPLVVFFPTEKETSLGFLIQGPYRTTPARDNVPREDAWNAKLVVKTAKLIVGALMRLKAMKLLTVAVLKGLPIDPEYFPKDGMFRPIYDEVCVALRDKLLLPTDDEGFVAGRQARLGRGEALRKLLSPKQLRLLYSSEQELRWLSGEITEDRTYTLRQYLIRELAVAEIDPERLAADLTREFLEHQDDRWMVKFYRFLNEQTALWRPKRRYSAAGPLRAKAIIRLENGVHVVPFDHNDRPNAYLPGRSLSDEYPFVRSSLVKHAEAAEFLQNLGLRKVADEDIVRNTLDTWYRFESPFPAKEEHLAHMKLFVNWYKRTSDLAPFQLSDNLYYFLRIGDGSELSRPTGCYIDTPYETTNLSYVYDGSRFADEEWFRDPLWDGYLGIDNFGELAKAVGIAYQLPIEKREVTFAHPDWPSLYQEFSNVKRSQYIIDEDHIVSGLEELVGEPRAEVSNVIWKRLCSAEPETLYARYMPNRSYDVRVVPSSVIHTLRKASWIPARDGKFYDPRDMTREMLPTDFVFDNHNGWLDAIGFGANAKEIEQEHQQRQQFAQALGIKNPELIEWIKEIQDDEELIAKIKSQVEAKRHSVAFPVRPVQDAERRATRFQERVATAPAKNYEQKMRSTRVSKPEIEPAVWLRNQYTNDQGEMVCQICHGEMPFRKRDGDHYFEAVEILSADELAQEQAVQYLALCPLCAAKYKEFIKREPEAVEGLREKLVSTTDPEVRVQFHKEEAIIRFVETHWHDLQVILKQRPKMPATA